MHLAQLFFLFLDKRRLTRGEVKGKLFEQIKKEEIELPLQKGMQVLNTFNLKVSEKAYD